MTVNVHSTEHNFRVALVSATYRVNGAVGQCKIMRELLAEMLDLENMREIDNEFGNDAEKFASYSKLFVIEKMLVLALEELRTIDAEVNA